MGALMRYEFVHQIVGRSHVFGRTVMKKNANLYDDFQNQLADPARCCRLIFYHPECGRPN
jgi:hypothetical protein